MRLLGTLVLTMLALAAPCSAAAGGIVFGAGVQGAPGFSYFPLWARVLQQTRMTSADHPALSAAPVLPPAASASAAGIAAAACTGACALNSWNAFLQSARHLPREKQLDAVNRWANAKPYVEDWANWGVPDYWETPAEFIARGGDCEDFAIAKYFSLVRLGFSPDDLRIVIVNDSNLQAFHAVLAVRQSGQTWLLDNAVPAVVPMTIAVQYTPIYALNERSWWLYSAPRIVVSDASVAENGPAGGPLAARSTAQDRGPQPAPVRGPARARPKRTARGGTIGAG